MAKPGSLGGRGRDRASRRQEQCLKPTVQQRKLRLEQLERRALLATYNYPFGAQPYDTGEYMLGDVAVNVVLMESDPSLAPHDNNPATNEDWTAGSIAAVKANIEAGLQWWEDTLVNMFPNAPGGLLDFEINWHYADNPVHTGYEPITRISDDFHIPNGSGPQGGWIYDFLRDSGFDQTGNFSADVRAFNDYTRVVSQADWAFTIFVVNNVRDADKEFAQGGSFQKAFAYAGGRFMMVPASRPASTYAHETGHQFWALDQYFGSSATYDTRRGYYNSANTNAPDNPTQGYVRQNSIMSRDEFYENVLPPKPPDYYLSNAYANHTSDVYALAQIGWQDSDQDGIFDVLDVPFSLTGSGQYNAGTKTYTFTGSTVVGTLPNMNSSGSGSDITINQINQIQVSINGGPWVMIKEFEPRTYQKSFTAGFEIDPIGIADIRLRSIDVRTGVTSNVFFDDVEAPPSDSSAVSGVVFRDLNSNGRRDAAEPALPDVGVEVLDENNETLDFVSHVEPSEWSQGMVLNNVASDEGVVLSAIGSNVGSGDVFARTSTVAISAGKVFGSVLLGGAPAQVWNQNQKLRVDFSSLVSSVSLRAFGGLSSGQTFARLEAYDSAGNLLTRFNTGSLTTGSATTMTVSRSAGDIHHIIAYGRYGTSVVLDTLQWGAATSATSNTNGEYSLASLPDGTYRVWVTPPAGYVTTTPYDGFATVIVSGGQSSGEVDFGISTHRSFPFHNVDNAFNVNNDAGNVISPIDALLVINYLNSRPAGAEGEISSNYTPAIIGFVDVNDDGLCAPNDALAVINYINSHQVGGEGEQGASSGGGSGGESGAEGETGIQVPRNAAEYYALNPVQLLQVRGDDEPCSCAVCVGERTDAALTELQSPEALSSHDLDRMDALSTFLSSESSSVDGTLTRSSSPLLIDTRLTARQQRGRSLITQRKQASIAAERTLPEVEEALDELALDLLASDGSRDAG